jgi:transposase-like protein
MLSLASKLEDMEVQDQIKELFKTLDTFDQGVILKELFKVKMEQIKTINIIGVSQCPYCSSDLLVKNGHRKDIQRFRCKVCHKTFSSQTGTSFHGIKKIGQFEEYRKLMFEQYLPLHKIAEKIGISYQTAFDWRHKILSGLNSNSEVFRGITEIDDVWFLYSQKGRKGLKYSRKRGGSKRQGDNKFQVKLLITADRESNRDFSVAKIGRITKSDIERKLGGKFDSTCTLVSDKHRSISSFAKTANLKHINFKSSEHTAGGEYHVQNVNNLASRMKSIINHSLRGVSTKYLQNYSNWFAIQQKTKTDGGIENQVNQKMGDNKRAWGTFTNIETNYKQFIENQSERTYRCPTKRSWKSNLNKMEAIGNKVYL